MTNAKTNAMTNAMTNAKTAAKTAAMTAVSGSHPDDRYSASLVQRPPASLAEFNRAGVLGAGDVHAAEVLCRLGGADDDLLLAAALAVRAPRYGHTCVDLRTVHDTVTADDEAAIDVGALSWPQPDAWRIAVASSPAVHVGAGDSQRPLRLHGWQLYLERFWRYERRLAERILSYRSAVTATTPTLTPQAQILLESARPGQGAAIQAALDHQFSVIAGGPGTGKTATITRLVATVIAHAHATGAAPPVIALAAPTGKAAARLTELLRAWTPSLPLSPPVAAQMAALSGTTIHRLLGWKRREDTRFWHDADNPLTHDLVVVDESSMVPLALMTKLFDALGPKARLVLVGDPDQLESVEAGSVLADVMGPTATDLPLGGSDREATPPRQGAQLSPRSHGITVLSEGYRFDGDSGIALFARAVRRGDADRALAILRSDRPDVRLIQPATGGEWPSPAGPLAPVFAAVTAAAGAAIAHAHAGDAAAALTALTRIKVLCATRRGPAGVRAWSSAVEREVAPRAQWGGDPWYEGRPVIVTKNNYPLGVFNGDLGIVVRTGDGPNDHKVVVGTPSQYKAIAPVRLAGVETVYALTIHKSQGSQFDDVAVVLPDEANPVLSRDLLYTAVTRAASSVTIIATEAILRHTIARRVQRVSGLRDALWPPRDANPARVD